MDRVDELVQLVPLAVGEQARLLVAAREVDVHVGHVCDANVMWCDEKSVCVLCRDPAR